MINKRKHFNSMIILFYLLLLTGCNYKIENSLDEMEAVVPSLESDEKADKVDVADEAEQINPESHRELSLVGVVDDYDSAEELSDFFASQDSLEKMVSFNQILNSQFEFYEIYTQSLQSKFYWDMDDSFLKSYDGAPIKNQEIEIEGEKCFISTLNSIEVNLNAFHYFFDFIGEGRGLGESDFQYKRNEKIPVILGSDYKSFYSVGDCIYLNYLEKDFEYEIIGFFEEGLSVKIENSEYNINKYLCVPYFEFDGNVTDESEKVFWLRHYQEKNLGYIKVDNINGLSEEETIEFYGSEIQKIAEELDIKYNVLGIIYHINIDDFIQKKQEYAEEYVSEISGTWQDAYKNIISNIQSNLSDPYSLVSEYSGFNEWVYVGLHDFDNNDIPELIIGSSVSVAVFTYEEGKAEKVADLYETEEWGGLNYLCYRDNHLVLICCGNGGIDYPGGNGYVCFTYEQGEYITGFYCDYHPDETMINGEHVSGEEFLLQFDVLKLKENSHIEYCKVNNVNEITLADSDEWIAIDDLDFSLIEW